MNREAAGRAAKEFGAQIVEIRKTSPEYSVLDDKPTCPSVAVEGRIIVRDSTLDDAQLRTVLASRKAGA